MRTNLLLKSHKNEVFHILQGANLDPANFSWSEVQSSTSARPLIVSRLDYRDGHFYFQFDNDVCIFSPGEGRAVQHLSTSFWEGQIEYTQKWAYRLKQEIDTPNLWQELEKYRPTFSLVPPEQLLNEPIPSYEVDEIVDKINELSDKMEQLFELTEEQNKFIRSRLKYLAEAAKRQGRLDWVHTCIGVLVTIATALAMAPAETTRLWQLVKNLLGGFIRLIGS